ncbi:hypothetical protein D3C87_1701040 [compost metagenome]
MAVLPDQCFVDLAVLADDCLLAVGGSHQEHRWVAQVGARADIAVVHQVIGTQPLAGQAQWQGQCQQQVPGVNMKETAHVDVLGCYANHVVR